jgi:Ca2+-binding RTX toxin-like protein
MATIYGNWLPNTLDSNDGVTNGADTIFGYDGSDTIYGWGGDDFIWGGEDSWSPVHGGGPAAWEIIDGGPGNDTAVYLDSDAGVEAWLIGGGDGYAIGDNGDLLISIENITGSLYGDVLDGDGESNVLDGSDGNDELYGHDGTDTLIGGSDDDELNGGNGADTLDGGPGNDTAMYDTSSYVVTVNLISGAGFVGIVEVDTLSGIENVTGSRFDDDLTGDANVNQLLGSNGDDTLKGGGGGDTLDGGTGIDTVSYGDSASGVTVDLLTGAASGDTALGDILISIENLSGSLLADTLTGDTDANVISGAAGDDWLKGGGGADTLDGGPGNDTATYLDYGTAVTVSLIEGEGWNGAAEGDVLTDIENLYGTAYADGLEGDDGANILHGDGGDDVLKGWGGADRLIGGSGIDTVSYIGSTGVTVNLAAGTGSGGWAQGDTLTGIENIFGSTSGDTLIGDALANDLDAGAGDDALRGGAGADILDGGTGTDTAFYIESAAAVDVDLLAGTAWGGTAEGDALDDIENLVGSLFDDDLTGDDNANVLVGGIGVDELVGNGGDDTLDGGIGDDWLVGGLGADTLTGGTGLDFILYSDSSSAVTISLAAGTASGGQADGDTFSSIENIAGSDFADVLTGNTGNNFLLGDDGDDTMVGGLGADVLVGFAGNDTVSYAASTDAVIVNLAAGTGAGGDAEGDSFSTVENVTGSDFADTLIGNASANVLVGRDGDDTYVVDSATDAIIESGGQGSDTVRTSVSFVLTAGADVERLETTDDNGTSNIDLTGNATNNIARGNNGNNLLAGGGGNDELTGLGGQDSFLFDTPLDAALNLDVVTDFNVTEDTILLDQTVFSSSLGLGNISVGEFVIGATAQDANDRIIYDGGSGALLYDSDGVGGTAAVQFAELSAGLTLTNLDFLVVA